MNQIWTYYTYSNNGRFYMMIQVFWDLMLCRVPKIQYIVIPSSLVSSTQVTGLLDPEDEGTMILWNVWNYVTQQHSKTANENCIFYDLYYCNMFKLDYFISLECNTMVGERLPTCARNVTLSSSVLDWLAFEDEGTMFCKNVKKLFTQWQRPRTSASPLSECQILCVENWFVQNIQWNYIYRLMHI